MNTHDDLDDLLGIQDTDTYGKLRDRLINEDDCLLEALVAMRKHKRLTQDEIAERMGRSKTAVSNFERLGSDPHLSTIRRYAAAVGALVTHSLDDYDICRASLSGPISKTVRFSAEAHSSAIEPAESAAGNHGLAWSNLVVRRATSHV